MHLLSTPQCRLRWAQDPLEVEHFSPSSDSTWGGQPACKAPAGVKALGSCYKGAESKPNDQ
jgi:hypothetical protein